jgi:hypothetical protein
MPELDNGSAPNTPSHKNMLGVSFFSFEINDSAQPAIFMG